MYECNENIFAIAIKNVYTVHEHQSDLFLGLCLLEIPLTCFVMIFLTKI